MNFRKLLFSTSILFVLLISSCVIEDSNVVQIPFASIVGTYAGVSKICIKEDMQQDTSCSSGIQNKVSIIIFDSENIIVRDEEDIFNKLKLTYDRTIDISNEKSHLFSSGSDVNASALIYNENQRSVQVKKNLANDSKVLFDYFIGSK